MTECFQAAPGTYLLQLLYSANAGESRPVGVSYTRIHGWQKVLNDWQPVVLDPSFTGYEDNMAVMTVDHVKTLVEDCNTGTSYDSADDWFEDVKGAKPVAKPNKETGIRRRVNLYIQFGKKTYVHKSFWHFKSPSDQFLFELEGGEEAPEDPRVQKINRDSYFKARKHLEVVPFADLFNTTEVEEAYGGEDLI